jgi:hypothetical protein
MTLSMSKPVGRPPKPVEQKRRAGNPGKRPLPDTVIAIPTSSLVPEPHRPLGQAGRQFWDRVWNVGFTWISPQMDIELLQIVAEQIDERASLRVKVLRESDWRDRSALRALDAQVLDCLSLLGWRVSHWCLLIGSLIYWIIFLSVVLMVSFVTDGH